MRPLEYILNIRLSYCCWRYSSFSCGSVHLFAYKAPILDQFYPVIYLLYMLRYNPSITTYWSLFDVYVLCWSRISDAVESCFIAWVMHTDKSICKSEVPRCELAPSGVSYRDNLNCEHCTLTLSGIAYASNSDDIYLGKWALLLNECLSKPIYVALGIWDWVHLFVWCYPYISQATLLMMLDHILLETSRLSILISTQSLCKVFGIKTLMHVRSDVDCIS